MKQMARRGREDSIGWGKALEKARKDAMVDLQVHLQVRRHKGGNGRESGN